MNLILIKSENFGQMHCDFWQNEHGDILMTREQIGTALEYAEPRIAVANIHNRNKVRFDKFSAVINLITPQRTKQETTLYTAKGIYEICRFSRQPKADAFMDWVWDIVEGIRTGKLTVTNKETSSHTEKLTDITESLKTLLPLLDEAGASAQSKLLVAKSLYKKTGLDLNLDFPSELRFYDTKQIAKRAGLYTRNGYPAYHAAGEIIKSLELEEGERQSLWETTGSWQGTVIKYAESVIGKVREWVQANDYPTEIRRFKDGKERKYTVCYTPSTGGAGHEK